LIRQLAFGLGLNPITIHLSKQYLDEELGSPWRGVEKEVPEKHRHFCGLKMDIFPPKLKLFRRELDNL
jgi:hypothetical protein